MGRARSVALWALCGALAAGGLALLRSSELPRGRESTFCLLRRATGIPCPGCGMTRAFDRLADGDWAGAVAAHPLAPLIALELAVGWVVWGLVVAGRMKPPEPRRLQVFLLAHLAALVALWLGRAATGTLPW